jgi:hypothetical protein
MVAMGGGPETPQRGNDQKRELLLCVQPIPETDSNMINEIKEEFPNLEVEYHHYEGGSSLDIPEGMCDLFGQRLNVVFSRIRLVPACAFQHCVTLHAGMYMYSSHALRNFANL